MRVPGSAIAALPLLAAGTLLCLACAGSGGTGQGERGERGDRESRSTVLSGTPVFEEPMDLGAAAVGIPAEGEEVDLSFVPPQRRGEIYSIVAEWSGETKVELSTQSTSPRPTRDTHLLELEYRELPTSGGGTQEATLLSLDALHYRLRQENPEADREVELGADQLRTFANGEVVMDLRGTQPKADLTPRKLLGRVFASLRHDEEGSAIALRPAGYVVARRFLAGLPLGRAISYSRLAQPQDPIAVGAQWQSVRFPVSTAGGLGLGLDIEYTLVGYQDLGGVPCAWIVFRADEDSEDVRSAAGFLFGRVVASVRGDAWVELATRRLRRLEVQDEIRVSYRRGTSPGPTTDFRMRHKSRLVLERRREGESAKRWADGTERFGVR